MLLKLFGGEIKGGNKRTLKLLKIFVSISRQSSCYLGLPKLLKTTMLMLCLHPIYYKKGLGRSFVDPTRVHFNFPLIVIGSGWAY